MVPSRMFQSLKQQSDEADRASRGLMSFSLEGAMRSRDSMADKRETHVTVLLWPRKL